MSRMDTQYWEFGCPALMSDGRLYTSHVSNQTLTDAMKRAYGFDVCKFDNNDWRRFLQQNATAIMQRQNAYYTKNYRCHLPVRPMKIELPYQTNGRV